MPRRCGDIAERFEPGAQKGFVDGRGPAGIRRAFEEDLHLDVSARNAFADGGAEGRLDGVELNRHVEMHVEAAMIDGLDGEREFAGG